MADSWLTDGDCKVCRRKSYCETECKKHRIKCERELRNYVASKIVNKMLDAVSTSEKKK